MENKKPFYYSFGIVELFYFETRLQVAEMTTNKTSDENKAAIVDRWKKIYGPKFYDSDVKIKTTLYQTPKKILNGRPTKNKNS